MFTALLCLLAASTGSWHYPTCERKQLSDPFLSHSAAFAIEVEVENPPPEQIDNPEWTMIPDESGQMHMVNTFSAMNAPIEPFNLHTGVIFELYTLRNPTEAQILHTGNLAELADSYFDPSRPTRFIVHGWNTNGGVTTSFQKGELSGWMYTKFGILKASFPLKHTLRTANTTST